MAKVLITDYDFPDHSIEQRVLDAAGIAFTVAQVRSPADVIAAGGDCDALMVQYATIDERVLDALPRVGLVSRMGAGFDTIDTAACARRGVWVTNSPDYGVGEVATHALALALALLRNVVAYHRDVNAGTWHFTSSGKLFRASDMTLGIVGLGRIGKRMAHVGRNVFRNVIACDPYIIDGDFPAFVARATLAEVFEQSHVVSLHVPLTAETRGMIGRDLFARMRRGAYLVNTARGAVIDVDAALAALDAGTLAGLGLDVLPVEPVAAGTPLLGHPRVILTPHAAFYSVEAERELREKAVRNVVSWVKTGRPDYPVSPGNRRCGA